MTAYGKYDDLKNEIEKIVLRPGDMGAVRGKFEHHFFGSGDPVKLPKDVELTYSLWKSWYEQSLHISQKLGLEPTTPSDLLDMSFQEHFEVRLPPGKHVTPELCSSWQHIHLSILVEIWRRRHPTDE